MIRRSAAVILAMLATGCVNLPGEESQPSRRYDLTGPDNQCTSGGEVLSVSIVRVGAGLDKNRIARRDTGSGEITYLKGVRWAESSAALLEQRMARDLECRGYTVITSHRRNLANPQLSCELRRFNLTTQAGDDRAEVNLSCLLSVPGEKAEVALNGQGEYPLQDWSAERAVHAISKAYGKAFESIAGTLSQQKN